MEKKVWSEPSHTYPRKEAKTLVLTAHNNSQEREVRRQTKPETIPSPQAHVLMGTLRTTLEGESMYVWMYLQGGNTTMPASTSARPRAAPDRQTRVTRTAMARSQRESAVRAGVSLTVTQKPTAEKGTTHVEFHDRP